jgi:hypothetical protein
MKAIIPARKFAGLRGAKGFHVELSLHIPWTGATGGQKMRGTSYGRVFGSLLLSALLPFGACPWAHDGSMINFLKALLSS